MRHHKFDTSSLPTETPVAAVWPAPPLGRGSPAEEEFRAADAMADLPSAVGRLVGGVYAGLIFVFYALFARSPVAVFAITVCAFFVAIFFAVPKIFLAVEAAPGRRPTMAGFLRTGIDTLTGRTSGRDALVQMLTVPVLLLCGLAAMGIIGLVYIP